MNGPDSYNSSLSEYDVEKIIDKKLEKLMLSIADMIGYKFPTEKEPAPVVPKYYPGQTVMSPWGARYLPYEHNGTLYGDLK